MVVPKMANMGLRPHQAELGSRLEYFGMPAPWRDSPRQDGVHSWLATATPCGYPQ